MPGGCGRRGTFEENAVKKAVAIAHCTGKPALADDSGLEVAALDGAPGTSLPGMPGNPQTTESNIEKLLREMRTADNRTARFVCCIALAVPEERVHVFFGHVTVYRESAERILWVWV